MITVVIKDGEPSVVQYTFEQLYTELKDIPGSELLVKPSWDVENIKNRLVCFVESDCLVSKGYFKNQLEALKKLSPRVIALGSPTAVKHWDNQIFGYKLSLDEGQAVYPIRKQKTSRPYATQIVFIPGAIMRTTSLKKIKFPSEADLVYYSTKISSGIWNKGITYDPKHPDGQLSSQIYLNPEVCYATTEEYVNDLADFREPMTGNLMTLFQRESI